ncbi:MAG TPA: hypothetical protein V6D08_15600 [Candidatus Obscuribacterales bacterium]
MASKVQDLTSHAVSDVSIDELKDLLVVLIAYLSLAPTYEDAVSLGGYIASIRQEIALRSNGRASLEVRPPPDS